jgi:hypothetical protein
MNHIRLTERQLINFRKKVIVGDLSQCWNWTGAKAPGGYGRLNLNGRNTLAHRVAHMIASDGPIPEGMSVLHSCDNPSCVNPGHLSLGDHLQNMKEMKNRGRSLTGDRNFARVYPEKLSRGDKNGARTHIEKIHRGETHKCAKFTDEQIRNLLSLRGKISQRAAAKLLGISHSHVSKVWRGEVRKTAFKGSTCQ